MTLAKLNSLTVVAAILSALVLPPFGLTATFSIRFDDVLCLVLIPFLLVLARRVKVNTLLCIYVAALAALLLSILQGYLLLEVPPSIRDLAEMVRLLKPLFLLAVIGMSDIKITIKALDAAMILGAVFVVIIGLVEFANIGRVNEFIGSIYSTPRHTRAMTRSVRRIIVTASDPNIGAGVALIFFNYIYARFRLLKAKWSLVLAIALAAVALMTSSRTGAVALAGLLGAGLASPHTRVWTKIFMSAAFSLGAAIIVPMLPYLVGGFELTLEGKNLSFNARLGHWANALQTFWEAPLFGWGPAKGLHTTIVDGEYFLLLRRYGVVGTVLVLASLHFVTFSRVLDARNVRPGTPQVIWAAVLGNSIIAAIFMVSNVVFSGYQLLVPIMGMAGVAFFSSRSNGSRRESECRTITAAQPTI